MKYGTLIELENTDIRRRHPADAEYYRRREQNQPHNPSPRRQTKTIRYLNYFIFYSILAALVVGICMGLIDLFVNFRVGGLLFSIIAMAVIISGVRIINREKREDGRRK